MSDASRMPWLPLADELAATFARAARRPRIVAISGAQGSGKTTLATLLAERLSFLGVRAASCSLDDFYYDRPTRAELARSVHPLLITRGVPGTHDVELCERVLADVLVR